MAGSNESNPHLQKASSSKKSGKSGKRKDKQVRFDEEPSSKRQKAPEDDYSEYRSRPLESISPAFKNRNPYLNNGIYVDLKTLADLGYDLTEYLEKYMNWLGLQNDYNRQGQEH